MIRRIGKLAAAALARRRAPSRLTPYLTQASLFRARSAFAFSACAAAPAATARGPPPCAAGGLS